MTPSLAFDLRLRHDDQGSLSGELVNLREGRVIIVRSLLHLAQVVMEEMDVARPIEATALEKLLDKHRASRTGYSLPVERATG